MAAVCCRPTAAKATGNRSQGHVELADILRRYGPAFRRTHRLSADQHKALDAIEACRTAALGGHADACPRCGYARYAYHSCRNRHCPQCQTLTKARWVQARTADLLPVPYFHVVFSLPHELNNLVLFNRKALIHLLFSAASRTLADFGRNTLGGKLGFTMILHTWDQKLNAHIHLHALVAGGALADDGAGATRWVATGAKFLFPVHAMSKVFRGKFLAGLKALRDTNALTLPVPPGPSARGKPLIALLERLYRKAWAVYAKTPFDGPERTLEYLGRYTHRVAISNHRILSADSGTVQFTYRDRRDGDRIKILALPACEFLRRFCLHVLPTGLVRVRHFGFLASRSKATLLAQCRHALGQSPPPAPPPARTAAQWILALTGRDITACPRCGHRPLRRVELPPATAHLQPPRRGPPSPTEALPR
jgi:hypothetical protein